MKKRISVPEDSVAIILKKDDATDLYSLCRGLRTQGTRYLKENANAVHEVAGVVLLAYIERHLG